MRRRVDPENPPLEPLDKALAAWPAGRLLAFCDEDAPAGSALDALAGRGRRAASGS